MINIAVCDDDVKFAASLEERILAYDRENHCKLEVDVFSDGIPLVEAVSGGSQYDLVYMDIKLGRKNGITAVREIKKMLPNILVIYTTAYDNYFTEMFETEPFRYLRKPVAEEQFADYLDAALKRIKEKVHYFTYTSGRSTCRLPVLDICFFESHRRKLVVHGRSADAEFYGRLGEVEQKLKEDGCPFLRIHQSYLVNPYEISRFHPGYIVMENGESLPVSENRQREIKEQYHEFLRKL